MSDEIKGQEPVQKPPAPDAPAEEPKVYDREYVKELRDEAASWRKKVRALEQRLEQDDAAKKAAEDTALAEQNKWKELAEKREQEINALKAENLKAQQRMLRVQVASKHGLNIVIDDETGETLADRLHGETLEELEKDAARLKKLFVPAEKTETTPDDSQKQPEQTEQKTAPAVNRLDATQRRSLVGSPWVRRMSISAANYPAGRERLPSSKRTTAAYGFLRRARM